MMKPGTRLGPYEIVSPLGAGGMGEVFRARDTRLDRSVAIKILPPEFAQNAQLQMRFEREAKTISQLNHPHICTVHDVGQENGVHYLVMELLEGETLADRLSKGPLPLEEVLRHGIEIASALDRAHREGIIHRDLKPANVVLTKTGAKLLDFGLAKSGVNEAPSTAAAFEGATQHKALTQEGTIVGTFQYMAPEQVSGEAVDARTDIFALGAVLYEMLTGVPAFRGKNRTSIVAAILSGEPQPISAVQPLTPPALQRVVKTCLEKDPDDRWQTVHDVMLELKWIEEGGSQAGVAAPVVHRRRVRERAGWTVAVAAVLAAVAMTFAYFGLRLAPAPVLRVSINPPPEVTLTLNGENSGSLTISPDGHSVTFAAKGEDGKTMLWLRPIDSQTAQPIPGTENAVFPFWSPDSRFIAFFSEGKLKKVDLSGAPALTICDAPNNPRSGSWNKDGIIIFSPSSLAGIFKVPAAGGRAVPVTKVDSAAGETTHRWATFLPDGRHFLYMVGTHSAGTKSETNAICAGSIDSPAHTLLVHARSNAAYAAGYLLYVRDRILIAQPFDPGKLRLTGDPIPIAQNVQYETAYFRAAFSVSGNGTLVYHGGSASDSAQMRFYDRTGKALQPIGEPAQYSAVSLSPDAREFAAAIEDPGTGVNSIWIHNIARNVRTRFTFGTLDQSSPLWSPDGSRIAYLVKGGTTDIVLKNVSGSAQEQPLVRDETVKFPTSWSPDGRYLAYDSTNFRGKSKTGIWIAPLFGDRKPFPFLRSQFNEGSAQFSPDGHWIAYASDESGRPEVYIVPFPGPGGKWQVSGSGWGRLLLHWRHDGREIIYSTPEGKLMAVPVAENGSSVTIGTPVPLFDVSTAVATDITADHSRVLVAAPANAAQDQSISLVTNWPATLKK